jgi:hypothetical protein
MYPRLDISLILKNTCRDLNNLNGASIKPQKFWSVIEVNLTYSKDSLLLLLVARDLMGVSYVSPKGNLRYLAELLFSTRLAIIHYSPSKEGSAEIKKDQIYLCDSGGTLLLTAN